MNVRYSCFFKVLDLDWQDPGRVDPLLIAKANEALERENNPTENASDNDEEMQEDEAENEAQEGNFDLFEDLNSELENNSNQVLRLTHTKTLRTAGVASMDKVLNKIRKNYETELIQEPEPVKEPEVIKAPEAIKEPDMIKELEQVKESERITEPEPMMEAEEVKETKTAKSEEKAETAEELTEHVITAVDTQTNVEDTK
jgi:hypothetical protein